jgi:hypothetical protein
MLLTLELFPGQGLGDFALGENPRCLASDTPCCSDEGDPMAP